MNFVLVYPQHTYVSNHVMEETFMTQQDEIKHDHFLYIKDKYYFLALMQHKDDLISCLYDWYGLISLATH